MPIIVTRFPCLVLFWFAVLGLAACSESGDEQPAAVSPDPQAIADNNHAVGLMGQFDYPAAHAIFQQLAKRYPDWLNVRTNLAIATLNRQNEGDEQAALAIAEDVLRADATHLPAHYVSGLMQLYLGATQKAAEHFRTVANADATDAYAAYYLAQSLAQQSQHEEALEWYRRAIALDPHLRSAYYGAFQTVRRLKRADEARDLIADYQRLANNPRAHLAEFKYTRMGPKAETRAFDLEPATPPKVPQGPVFASPSPLIVTAAEAFSWQQKEGSHAASITAVDLGDDGSLDLFLANVLEGDGLHNLMLRRQPDGGWLAVLDHPLASVPLVNAAVWGDFDNDGRVDVYLCRRGANQLWQQVESERWMDVTETTQTSGGSADTVDCAFFDADHDGDLDLFLVNADGHNELLNNNLDGTFRPLASGQGLTGNGRASRAVLPADLDGDRDTDIIVIHAQPPHEVFLNDRLWAYHRAAGFDAFRATPALAALAADRNADGHSELYTLGDDGQILRWEPDGDAYAPRPLGRLEMTQPGWAQLALLDADGDGVQDLMAASRHGWTVLGDNTSLFSSDDSDKLDGVTAVPLDAAAGPSVIGRLHQGGIRIWPPGPGRAPHLSLSLTGKEDSAQSMRSNASGIGTQVAIRTDSRWTRAQNLRQHSGPGQGLQPITVGLAGASSADFIAIDWSDGVFQSELNLSAGKLHRIAETQRQLSSCPVLFAWNGVKYKFISDLLGVGGIGYAVAPGEYATPRPWEHFLLPAGLPKPRDGRYQIKIGEPMEEVAYLDAARLIAYDLPPGWQMVLDERMGISGPEPTGKPYFYRQERLPDQVLNDRGDNVTDLLLHADGSAAPVGERDHRFIGRLQSEHILILNFSEPIDQSSGSPLLIADGWVEYPYSQTMFAAWQAGASLYAPTLEARGSDGTWHTVLAEFGYPAGMPRRMSIALPELPAGTTQLRLRTNMEIYWDRLAIGFAEELTRKKVQELPLLQARFAKTGFPERTTDAQRRPDYDYDRRRPFWDTRYMAGYYTRLGLVTELVANADDALAIIGAGEEVHLEFTADAPTPAAGWTRHLVLAAYGWAKDMDLYTRDGERVGPLPTSGKDPAARNRLHARYNTRYQAGR